MTSSFPSHSLTTLGPKKSGQHKEVISTTRQQPAGGFLEALKNRLSERSCFWLFVAGDTVEIIRLAVLHMLHAELRQRPTIPAFEHLDPDESLARGEIQRNVVRHSNGTALKVSFQQPYV